MWSIDETLTFHSGPGSYGSEGLFQIPQNFRIGVSLSSGLMSYPGHLFLWVVRYCLPAKMQSEYSKVAAN